MENFQCGDYYFSSNFDSGNLGRVELVRKSPDTDVADNLIHAEYNVWTVPDCFGTPYENPNRTWFFFAVRGGRPYRNIRINVRNLNRQAKLFSQGMQPVVRVGPHGKWERIKEKPIYNVEIDNFTISFTHRALDKVDVEHYYAFTYPFTYTECQNMLEKFDRKYKKCVHQVHYIISRLCSLEGDEKSFSLNVPRGLLGNSCSSILNCDECSDSVSDSILALERQTKTELLNDIYYHRELLINSIEGRRVDLLTISSFHGIEDRHEETLTNIFPELGSCRAHCFKDKKIIFLSSRVHPGETPASFVLNGFLNLILDRKSGIAATLRKLYVFKIVPILNPDGVYHGLYRTDTLGHNLNRMYINPKLHTQPSIYAVKKLIKYYHLGSNKFDEDAISTDNPLLCSAKGITNIKRWTKILKNAFVDKLDCDKNKLEDKSMDLENVSSNCSSKESTSPEESENIVKLIKNTINIDKQIKSRVFMDELIPELKTISKEPAVTKILSPSIQKKFSDGKTRKCNMKLNRTIDPSTSQNIDCKIKEHVATQSRNFHKKVQRKELKSSKSTSTFAGTSKIIPKKNVLSSHNLNINTEILLKAHNDDLQKDRRDVDENSNMFLYIDFHGHASKKGVFMYGNHFPNVSNAIECMLLPKLMSINCHHFHYDACNFSERNMYRKEKRDGLSKEGSGRVAVYKMTGLIKSYTLESNYNTGKYVNVLPPRNKDHVARITNIVPPKYTPAIYEEVGRALGPSILDLTNSNHLSRIQNSDFRTLQGMRISLRNEIDRNYSQISSVPSSAKVKARKIIKIVKRKKKRKS